VVVSSRIRAVFVLVDVDNVNAEEGVWKKAWECWVAEVSVDDQDSQDAEDNSVSETVEASISIEGPNDPVQIFVKECAVLLEDLFFYLLLLSETWKCFDNEKTNCLVFVSSSPVSLLGAIRCFN